MKLPTRGQWKVHTPQLLKEILNNSHTSTLRIPLIIFASLLGEVGERALELDDSKLNKLMCRLTIYSAADPYSPDYNQKLMRKMGLMGRPQHKKKNVSKTKKAAQAAALR